ncbi:class I adenylate cyclase [Desulfamplus magnetovallimortis]|uniref:class I adenylate cyclase n=1 Tax=Desulfamplus magnetovallimortis TaxID=1246637 RepID=UPI0016486783|nr:class I adenylate cyclase [Desulfamplus magnetovallimortis]
MNNFNQEWNRADSNQQMLLLEQAVEMSPGDAIVPVMAGLISFHFAVRNRARELLGLIQQRISRELGQEDKTEGILSSALVSVHVFRHIHANLSVQDLKLYLEILLESDGRSPFYAWKLCQGAQFSMQTLKLVASSISEQGRLALVSQYLSSTPSVRREYAEDFVKILRGISDRKAVLEFYADLFDKEIASDLFLENIKSSLRNPAEILASEFNNDEKTVEVRIKALKAAAILSEKINPSLMLKIITSESSSEIRWTAFKIIELSPVGTYFQLTDTIVDAIAQFNSASYGLVEQLIPPASDAPCKEDDPEKIRLSRAMSLFKAAVISRGSAFPLNVLIHRTIQRCPDLMPHIQSELSTLSKIALCFIQEMAEDPSGMLFHNSEVQHALICGIIRKRPERVIAKLEPALKHSSPQIQSAAGELTRIINIRLQHEKKSLRQIFDNLLKQARNIKIKKEKTGFFQSMFATTLGQKLEAFRDAASRDSVIFNRELIEDIDLSFNAFVAPAFFDQCVIRNLDFSFSSFGSAVFKNTMFYKVKMTGVKFEKTIFEKCVFIDVRADKADFNYCIFKGSSFFKSSFNSSSMVETVFAGCIIAATTFSRAKAEDALDQDNGSSDNESGKKSRGSGKGHPKVYSESRHGNNVSGFFEDYGELQGTDLSGATFASSQITYVSFVHAKLDKTDFSGATGKFCRFSPHSLSKAETEYSNLNSRIFELPTHEISPYLKVILNDYTIANELKMLLFSELIHQGKRLFLQKNRYAITVAFDLFQPEQADLFELIPLLIHENIDLYKPSSRSIELAQLMFDATWENREKRIQKSIPSGIAGYLPGSETEKLFRKYAAKRYLAKDAMLFIERANSFIEGVFTIGSIGSIAHTLGSDIDYWICIRSVLFSSAMMDLLTEKLRAIEQWAQDEFRTEIHFFVVDIEDARRSVFGESDSESSGSAQGRLLKEEFYRSMIHVAGKIPFWATLPVKVSKNYYHDLFTRASPAPGSGGFIDFGDIHDIPTGEYFGASVWQMFKYLKSPFKSVLKMGLLEKYIHEKKDDRMLLCNRFKDQWMNPGLQFMLVKSDPYYILLQSLVEYYNRNLEKKHFSEIVQSSFFSKINITDERDLKKSAFGLKGILVEKCIDEWGWDKEAVFDAGNFKNWSFSHISRQSGRIEKFMVKTYSSVRDALGVSAEQESLLTPRDRTVLGRKMFVHFNREESKVPTVLLVSKEGLLNGLTLIYSRNKLKKAEWTLMHKWTDRTKGIEEVEKLKTAATVEEIAAWLIHNHLYSTEAYIKLEPNPTHVRANDIRVLMKNMYDFFEDEMVKEITGDDLYTKSRILSLFVSINFTVPRDSKNITECCAVYRNSWGEMFCHSCRLPSGIKTSADVIYRVKRELDWLVVPEKYKLFRIQH